MLQSAGSLSEGLHDGELVRPRARVSALASGSRCLSSTLKCKGGRLPRKHLPGHSCLLSAGVHPSFRLSLVTRAFHLSYPQHSRCLTPACAGYFTNAETTAMRFASEELGRV